MIAIARVLEERHALVECFQANGGLCRLMPNCGLKGKLAAAHLASYRELKSSTLADCAYPAPKTELQASRLAMTATLKRMGWIGSPWRAPGRHR
jgi:DNA-binding IscR family transcriptional regulator